MTAPPADLGFDPRIADWLEYDAEQAPPTVLETVLAAVPSISQRRATRAPWRSEPMNRLVLAGGAIAAAAALAVGATILMQSPTGGPGARPSPSASASVAIPDGTYFGTVQQAATIRAALAADSTIDNTGRTAILDPILGIRGATTYQTKIEIRGPTMIVSSGVDGNFRPERWTISPIDNGRMTGRWANGTIEFDVDMCAPQAAVCSFSLRATSAAPSAVEAFVRRVTFETGGPFTQAP